MMSAPASASATVMADTSAETMTRTAAPLDYRVPYEQRDQEWVDQRQRINGGLTSTAPADVEFVKAIQEVKVRDEKHDR